jgi:uncharacterized protein YkwD
MAASGFLPILVLFTTLSWNDYQFRRYEKWYEKDSDKCFEIAKKAIKRDSKSGAPYYYASMLYLKEQQVAKNERSGYSHLNRSLSLAVELSSKKEVPEQYMHIWNVHLSKLDSISAVFLIGSKGLSSSKILNLEKKRKKLGFTYIMEEEDIQPIETNFVKNSQQFYGLPNGIEVISSIDPSGELEILELINEERKKLKMEPLILVESLSRAARYHSYDMATQDYFSHQTHDRINGKLVKVGKTFDRIRKFYTTSHVNSENIAAGNADPEDTYLQWFHSPGHYENMFNEQSRLCGIAVYYDPESTYKYYWTFCSAL